MLLAALREGYLVRFRRDFTKAATTGYVLDIGPRFFLIARVGDDIRFNGFECPRVYDANAVQPEPYTAFIEAALKKRGERKPRKPAVSVKTTEDMLESANRESPLITIYREVAAPGMFHVGRVMGFARGRVSFLEIGPDATWDTTPSEYLMSEITRVDFGGGYEEALSLVGGEPPKI